MRRFCSRHRLAIAVLFIAIVSLWAFGPWLHGHAFFQSERNCPGCQLERTAGCGAVALLAPLFVPVLVLLCIVALPRSAHATRHLSFLPRSFRSPPSALAVA